MTEEQKQAQANKPAKSRGIRLVNVGVLFLIVAVIIACYFMYTQLTSMYASTTSAIGALQKDLTLMQASSRDDRQQMQQITAELIKQSQTITEIRQLQGAHPDQWRVT